MEAKEIICPYCFDKFKDSEVHFRMETVFSLEEDCDPDGLGRNLREIEDTGDGELMHEYNLRLAFLADDERDQKYLDFWDRYGGTTEKSSSSRDRLDSISPYSRAVFDPFDPNESDYFISDPLEFRDGFVVSATDCFGKKTERRVCPSCHNPLPGLYGKSPVKFISVIGRAGSGKTVYITQLCNNIRGLFAKMGITAYTINTAAMEFIKAHKIAVHERLFEGSPPMAFEQPMYFDLIFTENGESKINTMVIYDIAGENCVDPVKMKNFGPFIQHSSGIIYIVDPQQFSGSADEMVEVTEAIYNSFGSTEQESIPFAVCISKGDTAISQQIFGEQGLPEMTYLKDHTNMGTRLFNAVAYNDVQEKLREFFEEYAYVLRTSLINRFSIYNYFIFSATGTAAKQETGEDGVRYQVFREIPQAIRIDEPVFWLLYQLGYIKASGPINPPVKLIQSIEREVETSKKPSFLGRLFAKRELK